MRAIAVVAVLLLTTLGGAAVWAAPVVIPDGTPLVLQITASVTAGETPVGTPVSLLVRDAKFAPQGALLVAPGGAAQAIVTASKAPRLVRRDVELDLKIVFVTAADGTRLLARLLPTQTFEGSRRSTLKTSPSLAPLVDIDGTTVSLPPSAEFVAYVDGDQKVEPQVGPNVPKPLILKGTKSLPDGKGGVMTAITLANPNSSFGLLNATVVVTAVGADGKPVGISLDKDPTGLEHRIVALRPGEMRTFIKRVAVKGNYAKCVPYVAQPWVAWGQPGVGDLSVLYSQWDNATTVTGMVRNDQSWPARVEVVAVVAAADGIGSFGRAVIDKAAAGETPKFSLPMLGGAPMGTKYDLYALGAAR
jgi:hypothetical protein